MVAFAPFFVIGGPDGIGKGTQVRMLMEALTTLGIECEQVREPGGEPIAEQLREILKFSKNPIEPLAEALMFLAARVQVRTQIVLPMLEAGIVSITDRGSESTDAYQESGRGLASPTFNQLVAWVDSLCPPTLTFILVAGYEVSQGRREDRGEEVDRFEGAGEEYLRAVNEAYIQMAGSDGYIRIDASGTPEEMHAQIMSHVLPVIQQWLNERSQS